MASPMKILAVSDRVMEQLYSAEVKQKYPGIDLLIGCGDLPYYYLDFLVSAFDRRLVYVRGNHDHGPQYTATGQVLEEVHGGTDIHGRCVYREKLLIAGLEGSMRYRPKVQYMYTEGEMKMQIASMLPRLLRNKIRYGRYLDIFVAHSPPFGIHDKSDLPHTGFKIFLNFIQWFQPKYMLHGHVHLYQQNSVPISKYLSTIIINVYPYYILEI
ncbi:MAG: metallophosphoesterase [Chloroflexi bacterium]|nr:metallophosphoesterase [Chloroflexota bacterium]